MFNQYKHFIIANNFNSLSEDNELLEMYQQITNKEYIEEDEIMLNLIRQYRKNNYSIYHVHNSMSFYVKIDYMFGCFKILFDVNKYKLDSIKKLLSSISDENNIISLIESIIFGDIKSPILSDDDYLKIIM